MSKLCLSSMFSGAAIMLLLSACSPEAESKPVGAGQAARELISLVSGTGPYPTQAVYDEFAATCGEFQNLAAWQTKAEESGWRPVDASQLSSLSDYIDNFDTDGKAIAANNSGTSTGASAYVKNVAGEDLVLLLSDTQAQGSIAGYCQLFDPDETREPDAAIVESTQLEPDRRTELDGITMISWVNASGGKTTQTEYIFIPQNNPAAAELKMRFDGLALKSLFLSAE